MFKSSVSKEAVIKFVKTIFLALLLAQASALGQSFHLESLNSSHTSFQLAQGALVKDEKDLPIDERDPPYDSRSIETKPTRDSAKLFCDESNYKEFIYDKEKTDRLIRETGRGCQFRQVSFTDKDKDFEKAYLRSANFSWAYVRRGNFRNADLTGAVLYFAYLGDSDLRGANMTGVYIYQTHLEGAKYNSGTKFPDLFYWWFQPEEYGMIYRD